MSIPIIGQGFGRGFVPAVPREETVEGRQELFYEAVVGGNRVTMIVRQDLAVEDPMDNMARAAAYTISTGRMYPVPPLGRDVKDYLIRTNIIV